MSQLSAHRLADEPSRLSIQFQRDRLSVDVHLAPWATVLRAVEQETGIKIKADRVPAGTLTHAFQDVPVDQALRRLFRDVNLVLVYQEDRPEASAVPKLVGVWLFPIDGRTLAESRTPQLTPGGKRARGQPTEPAPEETHRAIGEIDRVIAERDIHALQVSLLSPDQTIQAKAFDFLLERDGQGTVAFLLGMTKSQDPLARSQALFLLSEIGLADPSANPESISKSLP